MRAVGAVLIALVTLGLLIGGRAAAQEAITVDSDSSQVENNFPENITFILFVESRHPIENVRLTYQLSGGGTRASAVPEFQPGPAVRAEYTLVANNPLRLYIPPGTVITYHWEIEDAAGNRLVTDPQVFVYEDPRFQWQTSSDGNLTIYWYRTTKGFVDRLLSTGGETLDKMGGLLGAEIDFPVKVILYDSREDMLEALQLRSATFAAQVHTLGQRVSDDTVLVLNAGGASDTLRHELTHIITNVAGEGPFGSTPSWLDEGTAMYAQEDVGDNYQTALLAAARRNLLISLRAMSSPAGDPGRVNLWYAQAWSLVDYLVSNYGPQKFAELFATFKAGSTTDDALQSVYGLTLDSLEDEWRQSLGAEPRQRQPEATPTAAPQRPAPATPTATAGAAASQPATGDDGLPLVQLVVLGVLTVVLVAVVGLAGIMLARRLPR